MNNKRIGIVDLDSSHPASFTKAMREHGGFEIVAVYDGGDVREPGYATKFAAENGVPHAVARPEDMLGLVDGVVVLGVDWDRHLERARPFLDAGVPVFIDKLVFGRLRDGYAMLRLAEAGGAPLMGGSGVRYDTETIAMRDQLAAVRPTLDSAFACGPGTPYYYGIHTVEVVHTVLGQAYKVRRCGHARELFELVYRDGLTVWLRLECARPISFTVFARNKPARVMGAHQGYFNFLKAFNDMIETRKPPVPFTATLETTAMMIAVYKAKTATDWVYLDSLTLDDGPDGAAFTAWYRVN
jgi:predicted dehydrogenase